MSSPCCPIGLTFLFGIGGRGRSLPGAIDQVSAVVAFYSGISRGELPPLYSVMTGYTRPINHSATF